MDRAAEGALVFDGVAELVEFVAGAILDDRAPEFDDALRGFGRREAREALAHHHGDGVLQRRVRAVADLGVGAAVIAVLQHRGQIAGDARHAARADGLDARLLDGVEHGAGGLVLRGELAVHARVVTGELEGERIRMAAHDGGFPGRQLAGGLGQARLRAFARADEAGPLGGVGDFEFLQARQGAHAAGDCALERLLRGFGFRAGLTIAGRG